MLAEVYKSKLHLAGDVFIYLARDANPPRLRHGLETSSDVDAIAVDARLVKDDITLIDADAEVHPAGLFYPSIALRHRSLDCHRALCCIHYTAELCEDPVAGGINDAAAVLCDYGEYGRLMRLEAPNRAGFIRPHEGAVTSDIGRKNRCQPAENLGLFGPFGH